MNQKAIDWISSGDTGASSKCLWSVMMGGSSKSDGNHPLDPDDFGRCYRLLESIPEWRGRIGEMSRVSPYWAALAARWGEIESEYRAEIGGRAAEKTYELMRSILDPIQAKDSRVVRLGEGITVRFRQ